MTHNVVIVVLLLTKKDFTIKNNTFLRKKNVTEYNLITDRYK